MTIRCANSSTYCLTELACDASFLSSGVPPQHMLPSEARTQRALLERVVDLRFKHTRDAQQVNKDAHEPSRTIQRRAFLTVTFFSKKYLSVRPIPLASSVMRSVLIFLSRTARHTEQTLNDDDIKHDIFSASKAQAYPPRD